MKNQKEIQWLLKEKYHNKPNKNFKKDVRRIEKGEPIDYVIGFAEFLGCRIDLSKKTLIPRKETEYWVAIALDKIKNAEKFKDIKCLDMFSGSGCIGVALLANAEGLLCDFVDTEKNALSQIKLNLKNNFIDEKRYKVISSDIFKKVKGKYDFIFANPPYIPTANRKKIQKSVLKYEPKVALLGGKDGMSFTNKFLKDAKKHLAPEGKIFMEFDSSQKSKIEKILKKVKYKNWQYFEDQYGKLRWVEIE